MSVVLSTSLLNFGLIKFPEETAKRSFRIYNQSDTDAIYQVKLCTAAVLNIG